MNARKVAIYGLFDPFGSCLYVGQSVAPRSRFNQHRGDRFRDTACKMRVLRSCAATDANRLEVQIMLAYRARGQARMNRVLKAFGRPTIEQEQRAADQMQVRVTLDRKAAYVRAARAAGLSLSAWVFRVLDDASGFAADG